MSVCNFTPTEISLQKRKKSFPIHPCRPYDLRIAFLISFFEGPIFHRTAHLYTNKSQLCQIFTFLNPNRIHNATFLPYNMQTTEHQLLTNTVVKISEKANILHYYTTKLTNYFSYIPITILYHILHNR